MKTKALRRPAADGSYRGRRVRQKVGKAVWWLFRTGLLIGVAYVILHPLLIKLSVSFMSEKDMYDMSVGWIPRHPTLQNFRDVLEILDYGSYFATTLLVSTVCTLLQLISCSMAAYGFARFKFRGRSLLFFFVILMLIIPPQTYTTASYMQFRNFDFFGLLSLFGGKVSLGSLINTPLPMFILSAGCAALKNGLFIYVLRRFFENLPEALEEAAWVDGAGVGRIFLSVMLPNAVPAMTTVAVFSFVWTWNDLYSATTYMPSSHLFAIALSRLTFTVSRTFGDAGNINTVAVSMITNAGALLIILPLLLLFFAAQRFFVEGIERTGLTGT